MSKFTDAIEENWPDYTIAVGSSPSCEECFSWIDDDHEPTEHDIDLADEPSFTHGYHSPCECCGSRFGGDRHNAHAIHHDAFGPNATKPDAVYHISICTDCLLFCANGDEPEQWEQYP